MRIISAIIDRVPVAVLAKYMPRHTPVIAMKPAHIAYFRLHEKLNNFLPPARHREILAYAFDGQPGINNPIEGRIPGWI